MNSTAARFGSALLIAALVNVLLFSLMQYMISQHSMRAISTSEVLRIDYVRTQPEELVQPRREQRPPPERPEPQERPPEVESIATETIAEIPPMQIPPIQPSPAPSIGGAFIGEASGPQWIDAGQLVALTRVPPEYPAHARMRRIEGHVDVEFVVDTEGRVREISVINSEPPGIFDRAAMNSIRHWRFQPRRQDGRAIEVTARQRIEFNLN